MRYLTVKNFERFQHYHDRPMAWIKLHASTLRDYEFGQLPDLAKLHLVLIWLLVSTRSDRRIPDDPLWVAQQICAREPVNLQILLDNGWLIPLAPPRKRASKVVQLPPSEPEHLASLDKIRGEESREEQDHSSDLSASHQNGSADWPEADSWLKEFLEHTQTAFNGTHTPYLLDHAWWDSVSEAANGVDRAFLTREFSRMAAWLKENPGRKPTPKGVRRFVRTWLERSAERERKLR